MRLLSDQPCSSIWLRVVSFAFSSLVASRSGQKPTPTKRSAVSRGYWLRHRQPRAQLEETVRVFDLWARIEPFCRCIQCNGNLLRIDRASVVGRIPPRVARDFDEFSVCDECDRVYWRGSHYDRLALLVRELLQDAPHDRSA